ncbi:MAG: hypothetical protein A3J63_01455 [Candidatus Moranbacteria bacterium RIFCSPHIGHO2_02_FULL_40_12b]|nr:MAG: hypothetical protein A3J63_01455 [Candidatus Moranbacteria bacterium RIFCSPHIGHO2_02_FULL_40_12b]OGI23832.1 MAG: hypothetical protein A3E91_00350 [Candidatus Moranbacteria bacterium RIFCSPHIGHO2_12_FULL_40_10]
MAKNIINPDRISLTTHQLFLGFSETDKIIGNSTGFIYQKEDRWYIITNYHVVSGRNPETKECLSEELAIPNILSTTFWIKDKPGHRERKIINLYNKDNNPVWIEHPQFGSKVDVVAIPIPEEIIKGNNLFPINKIDFDNQFKCEVADDIFIIGYPFLEQEYLELPIWKKASIASEPDVNRDQLPKFLVDTATRKGLSGSPAIMQRTGFNQPVGSNPNIISDDAIFGRIRKFAGIYSGRIGKDESKAQLGIIWKTRVIDEILNSEKINI